MNKKQSSGADNQNPSIMSSSRPDQFDNDANYNALQMMEKIDLNDKIEEIENDHAGVDDVADLKDDDKKQQDLDSILNKYNLSNELIIFNDI